MEIDQNDIMSSEGTEPEIISNNIDEINEQTTTISESECRINCTNQQSLRNVLDVTLNHIEELADACNLTDSRSEFVTVFAESFKNALQENILVNGLPLMMDESKKLSPLEREDHSHMVDDVLFGKLSKKVAVVAHERKFFPEQCCRVMSIEKKHELQNLKKAKVTDSSVPSTASLPSSCNRERTVKNFSEFCQGFSTMQETVQCKLQEKEKLTMKLDLIKEIQKNEKNCSSKSKK